MAQKLIHATEADIATTIDALRTFWENGGNEHFAEEEGILLPTFARYGDVHREEIIRMLLDHVQIRSQVHVLTDAANQGEGEPHIDAIHRLGEHLQSHVRFEERTVFPLIQETVPQGELVRLPDFSVLQDR